MCCPKVFSIFHISPTPSPGNSSTRVFCQYCFLPAHKMIKFCIYSKLPPPISTKCSYNYKGSKFRCVAPQYFVFFHYWGDRVLLRVRNRGRTNVTRNFYFWAEVVVWATPKILPISGITLQLRPLHTRLRVAFEPKQGCILTKNPT